MAARRGLRRFTIDVSDGTVVTPLPWPIDPASMSVMKRLTCGPSAAVLARQTADALDLVRLRRKLELLHVGVEAPQVPVRRR